MNKIVILGCGYIGANVANFCVSYQSKNEIYVLGIENYYTKKLNNSITFIPLKSDEISDEHKYIFKDSIVIDAIGSTNATSSVEDAGIKCMENCIDKLKLLNKLYKLQTRKYIYLSSGGTIYGDTNQIHSEEEKVDPLNIYALEKFIIEEFLRIKNIEKQNLNYLILRLANPYGGIISPDKKQGIIDVAINKSLKGETIELYGDIYNVRDYIYMDELSEAIYKLAISPFVNDVYNIGTGRGYTIKEIFDEIEKQYNINIKVKRNFIKTVNIKNSILNINKIHKDIGFIPKIGIKEGIQKIKQERIKKGA